MNERERWLSVEKALQCADQNQPFEEVIKEIPKAECNSCEEEMLGHPEECDNCRSDDLQRFGP